MPFHYPVKNFPIIFPIAGVILLLRGMIYSTETVKQKGSFFFILTVVSAFFYLESPNS
jgi:hypothetical protein